MADIGIKIKLDGESQFSKDIKSATTNVKNLDSEMKLAEAQFKATGDQEVYLRQKTQILNEQITAQQKAVDAAKAALEQCGKQGLDKNSSKTLQWRSKLAQAETKLINLQTELGKTEKGITSTGEAFDDAKKDAGNFSSQLDSINKNISLQNVSDAVGAVNSAIDSGIKKVVEFGKKLWSFTSGSTDWADELATKSTQYGLDTTTLQQWEYAARFIDTDVSTIVAARDKLVKRSGDDDLLAIGVDPSQAKDNYDLMWMTLEAIGKMDEAAQEETAMKVFGKSYKELLPLIQAGREEWDKYADQAPVVSEENLQKLLEANDALQDLDANLEATKNTLLAQLAPALTTIANSLTGALDRLNEYLQTEEGQKKLQDFSDAVVRVAESMFDIDWSAAIDTAGKAFTAITDALKWIVDNKKLVIVALAAIAGVRLWDVLATAATNVQKLWGGAKTLLGLGGGAGASAGAGGATAAGAGASTAATAAGGGAVTKAGGVKAVTLAGGKTAATGATIVADTVTVGGTGGSLGYGTISTGLGYTSFGAAATGTVIGAVLLGAIAKAAASGNTHINQAYNPHQYDNVEEAEIIEATVNGLINSTGQGANTGERAMSSLYWMATNVHDMGRMFDLFNYEDVDRGASNYLIDMLLNTSDEMTQAAVYDMFEHVYGAENSRRGQGAWGKLTEEQRAALRAGQEAKAGIEAGGGQMDGSVLLTQLLNYFSNTGLFDENGKWHTGAKDLGQSYGDGYAEGIGESAQEVADAASGLGQGSIDALADTLDSHSPSEETRKLGRYAAQGYILGIQDELAGVATAAGMLTGATMARMGMAFAGFTPTVAQTGAGSGGRESGISETRFAEMITDAIGRTRFEIDGRVAGRAVAPTVAQILARQMAERNPVY